MNELTSLKPLPGGRSPAILPKMPTFTQGGYGSSIVVCA